MNLTRTEQLMAEAGIMAMIGCGFALLGLFVPAEMTLIERLVYWISGFLASWLVVRLLAQIGIAVAKLLGLAPLWGYAIIIPLSSAVIAWAILWWRGGQQLAMGAAFSQIWPTSILVGLGFFGLFYVLYSRSGAVPEPVSDATPAPGEPVAEPEPETGVAATQLHDKLPEGFPEVIALSVEDHYVRAHARDRSEMLLMSLAEASDLMPEGAGERVHRSWWVARAAVEEHRREGRDTRLILTGGLEVPVSRAQVKPLREAGWLG